MSTRRRQGDTASLPFFRKAIELDPDFALAHARLSTVYGNMGEPLRLGEHGLVRMLTTQISADHQPAQTDRLALLRSRAREDGQSRGEPSGVRAVFRGLEEGHPNLPLLEDAKKEFAGLR
jgi:hypothetical protein